MVRDNYTVTVILYAVTQTCCGCLDLDGEGQGCFSGCRRVEKARECRILKRARYNRTRLHGLVRLLSGLHFSDQLDPLPGPE
jgi:hypothetical protein